MSEPHEYTLQHQPGPISAAIGRGLVRGRWVLLAIGVALVAVSSLPASRLHFDRSIENMFSSNDPVLAGYDRVKEIFGGDEVVLAAYIDPDPLSAAGKQRLTDLAQELGKVAGVSDTTSLATVPPVVQQALGDALYDLFEGFLIGQDRHTVAVVCSLLPESEASIGREETIQRLRTVMRQHDANGVVAGAPIMVTDGFNYITNDGEILGWASSILLMATIILCFRSLRWMLIPLVIVNATLIMTKGLLVSLGWQLSMVSSMLWSIITVIGIATVVHVIVRYRHLRHESETPRHALELSLATLAGPVIWTCATDAVGFSALLFAEVGPVKDFGRMMAIGAGLTLVSIVLFLPGLAMLPIGIRSEPKDAPGEHGLHAFLRLSLRNVRRHRAAWLTAVLLVSALAAAGIPRLGIESDFTSNFRASTPIVQSYDFVERQLGGAGVWDIVLPVPESLSQAAAGKGEATAEDWQGFVDRIRQLESDLREIQAIPEGTREEAPPAELTKVFSVIDLYQATPQQQLRAAAMAFDLGGGLRSLFGRLHRRCRCSRRLVLE